MLRHSYLSVDQSAFPSGSSQKSQYVNHISALQPEYFQIWLDHPVKINRQYLPKPGLIQKLFRGFRP